MNTIPIFGMTRLFLPYLGPLIRSVCCFAFSAFSSMAVKMKPDKVAPVPITKEKKPTNTAISMKGEEELAINWKIFGLVAISANPNNAPSITPIPQ
jgi:hypothetical protein